MFRYYVWKKGIIWTIFDESVYFVENLLIFFVIDLNGGVGSVQFTHFPQYLTELRQIYAFSCQFTQTTCRFSSPRYRYLVGRAWDSVSIIVFYKLQIRRASIRDFRWLITCHPLRLKWHLRLWWSVPVLLPTSDLMFGSVVRRAFHSSKGITCHQAYWRSEPSCSLNLLKWIQIVSASFPNGNDKTSNSINWTNRLLLERNSEYLYEGRGEVHGKR